ncbi:MAG: hypothetical protein WC756_06605 [Taibaiella sp.]|jgi:ATP-dependent exoDNAse (exonuclease V) alpha subunit
MKEYPIILTSTNDVADQINNENLLKLETPIHAFKAKITGDGDKLIKSSLIPINLEIKIGAQVMILKNDFKQGVFNGMIGHVLAVEYDPLTAEEVIQVLVQDGTVKDIRRFIIKEGKLKKRKIGKKEDEEYIIYRSCSQFPLRLAYAFSIHKSQGLTFEAMTLNLTKNIFEAGQLYVALSRCKSLNGLTLTRDIRRSEVKVNPVLLSFYKKAKLDTRYLRIWDDVKTGMYEFE